MPNILGDFATLRKNINNWVVERRRLTRREEPALMRWREEVTPHTIREEVSVFWSLAFLTLHIRFPTKQKLTSLGSAKNPEVSGSCVTHNLHPTWRIWLSHWSSTCHSTSQRRHNRKWGFPASLIRRERYTGPDIPKTQFSRISRESSRDKGKSQNLYITEWLSAWSEACQSVFNGATQIYNQHLISLIVLTTTEIYHCLMNGSLTLIRGKKII